MNIGPKSLSRLLIITLALTAGFGVAMAQTSPPAGSPDAPVKGQGVVKVLLENDKVLVCEFIYAPGDLIPSRNFAHRVIQFLDSGTLRRIMADGKTGDVVFEAGKVVWAEAGTFAVSNIGRTAVRVITTELK